MRKKILLLLLLAYVPCNAGTLYKFIFKKFDKELFLHVIIFKKKKILIRLHIIVKKANLNYYDYYK